MASITIEAWPFEILMHNCTYQGNEDDKGENKRRKTDGEEDNEHSVKKKNGKAKKKKKKDGRGDYITKILCLCNLYPAVLMFKKPSPHKTDRTLRTLVQKNYKESYDWMVLSEINCKKIPCH